MIGVRKTYRDSRVRNVVLALSAAGYPIIEYAVRQFGRAGAAVVELACAGLLWVECATAAAAPLGNASLLSVPKPTGRVIGRSLGTGERTCWLATAMCSAPRRQILDLPAAPT